MLNICLLEFFGVISLISNEIEEKLSVFFMGDDYDDDDDDYDDDDDDYDDDDDDDL